MTRLKELENSIRGDGGKVVDLHTILRLPADRPPSGTTTLTNPGVTQKAYGG